VQHKTVGIIGAGRIGTAYARMMAEGHKMNIVYYDPYPNKFLETYVRSYGDLLRSVNEPAITCTRLETVEEVLKAADVRTHPCLTHASGVSPLALMSYICLLSLRFI
jgi:hydroxypyruvate reductase 1